MKTTEKILALRGLMEKEGIDAVLVPSCDAHMSEYVGEHWKARTWITGFTGSAGTAVITRGDAGLWTDGRYFIQAARQLEGSGVRLFRMGEKDVPTVEEWLAQTLPHGGCLAVDGRTLSGSAFKALEDALAVRSVVVRTDIDPVGAVWDSRPDISADPLFLHGDVYAGKTRAGKLADIRGLMEKRGADYFLVPSLDEIIWLYNIRGSDVPYNPYVTSFAVVGKTGAWLFVNPEKVPAEARQELESSGVQVLEYEAVYPFLAEIGGPAAILYDPEKTNVRLIRSVPADVRKIEAESLITNAKACKNDAEIENIRDCYVKDSVALVKLFKWLKESVARGEAVTELDVDAKGQAIRGELPLYMGLSFDTISAYGDHAPMMHYAPTPEIQYTLEPRGFYLIDSGCQFLNGTTDITRTVAMGPLSDEEKRDFTLTLRSLIALSTARFLYGSTGSNLDVLARMPMWENGLDYKCGTGHGVGYFSTVHEAPQRFAVKPNTAKLEKGMTITVEPGVYKEGKHGIRTENTLLVAEDVTTECGSFMKFETLTFLPIDRSAIVAEMLSEKELRWINSYHEEVFEKLSPYLDQDEKSWLRAETAEIRTAPEDTDGPSD